MAILLSIFFGFVPMIFNSWLVYICDRFEKEPKILIGLVFTWGAIIAAGGSYITNTLLGLGIFFVTGSETATNLTTNSIIAPFVEESLKGLAILIVFLFFRKEFDSILDGIIYAAITALGFAATENVLYIYQQGYLESGYAGLFGLVFIRVILVGWQHPFYSAFTGIGLAVSRLKQQTWIKILAPILGWSLAVFTHSFHNTIASVFSGLEVFIIGSIVDWTGWLCMLIFVFWSINKERKILQQYLSDEINNSISPTQFIHLTSAYRQSTARFNALFSGKYKNVSHFFQLCGELAHKKNQYALFGDEGGNLKIIENLRTEIKILSPIVNV